MLENLISKYKKKDIEGGIVYRLSYSGKFIIVKGRTLAGSLIIMASTYDNYIREGKVAKNHLYKHFYDHFKSNEGGRFRIKTLAKKGRKVGHYDLLKREQMELDKNRYNPLCLNNQVESYIPLYNPKTAMNGWIEQTAVMNFTKWLSSQARANYVKRYTLKPLPKPAKSGL